MKVGGSKYVTIIKQITCAWTLAGFCKSFCYIIYMHEIAFIIYMYNINHKKT